MEFGIGFALGAVFAGVAAANWSSVVKFVQNLAAKAQDAIGASLAKSR
jgi:hypothetical protein